ncbi:hypothetical protein DL89DRAFT_89891 [Linderina pennispora]|uniref:Uncharacterized protein n=1 Tax=Linderina pennispora TaxID=61395 RepID=A0A1Y1WI15_9FUNG|nr:uncharacterized protein DL89DRAFT_89891 [Linderina pennispora]ORX73220.1 hypothetical protein DL89DRAFT_89891 [Linderina pennispora]
MNHFVSSIESKRFACRRFEMRMLEITVRFLFFYANTSSDKDFMPSDKLEEGFYRTLALCPWFAGNLHPTQGGGMEVVVDKDNLNMPEYRESQSLVHFSKIQSAGFSRTTWPDGLVPVGPFPCCDKVTGKIKLVHIHVVRLKDNSGTAISINFNHTVADATSILTFLRRWADETRALISGVPVAEVSFCFGADIIKSHLPSESAPLSETATKVLSAQSRVADFIMWLSPNKRGRLMNYLTSSASPRGHLFRISRARIDGLRSQVLEYLPQGTYLSTNDIISAVLHRVHEQAATRKSQGWLERLIDQSNGVAGEHCTFVVINHRRHLGMTELNYMGNPAFGEFILTPMQQAHLPITPKTISVVAGQIRSQLLALTTPRIRQTVEILDSDVEYAADFLTIAMNYKVVTTATNITSIKMYDADFGHGVQAFSTIHPELCMRVCIILPSPPPSKDILVSFCDTPSVMDSVLKNEFWSDFAELVY